VVTEKQIEYANKLGVIGDEIVNISNSYFNKSKEYNNEIALRMMKEGIDKYKECSNSLRGIKAPKEVKVKHEKIIEELDAFINSAEEMQITMDASDVVEKKFQEDIFKECIEKEYIASKNIAKIAEEIGDIFLEV
jgi:hypothetical protein